MPIHQRYWETISRSKERAEEIRAFRRQAMSRTLRHETQLTNETQERIGIARKQLGAFFGDIARERSGITPERVSEDRAPILNLRTPTLEREIDRPATGRPTPPKRVLDALEMTAGEFGRATTQELQVAVGRATERTFPGVSLSDLNKVLEFDIPGRNRELITDVLKTLDTKSTEFARTTTGQFAAAGQIVNDLRRLKAPSRQELSALGGYFNPSTEEAARAEFERLPGAAKFTGESLLRPENILLAKVPIEKPFFAGGKFLLRPLAKPLRSAKDLLGRTVFKPATEAIVYADSAVRPPKPTDPMSTGVRDVQRQLAADIEFEPVLGLIDEPAAVTGRATFDIETQIRQLELRRADLQRQSRSDLLRPAEQGARAEEAKAVTKEIASLRQELRPSVLQGQLEPGTVLTKREIAASQRRALKQLEEGILPRVAKRIDDDAVARRIEEDPMVWARDEFQASPVIERMTSRMESVFQEAGQRTIARADAAVRVPTWLEAKMKPIYQIANKRIFFDPRFQRWYMRYFGDKETGQMWATTLASGFKEESIRVGFETVADARLGLRRPVVAGARFVGGLGQQVASAVTRGAVRAPERIPLSDHKLISQTIRYVGPANEPRDLIMTLPHIVEDRRFYAGLTAEQDAFLDSAQVFLRKDLDELRKVGAQVGQIDEVEYVAHVFQLDGPEAVPRSLVGAKQPMQAERTFTRLSDAMKAKLQPASLDFGDLMQVRLLQSGKIRADTRFIGELRGLGRAITKDEPLRQGEAVVRHWKLRGLAYPDELGRSLDDALQPQGRGPVTAALIAPWDVMRAIVLNLDASPLIGIQGVVRFIDSPAGWAQDTATSLRFIMSKRGWQRELAQNSDRYIQAASDGVRFFNNASELGQSRTVLKSRAFGPLMWLNDVQFQRAVSYFKIRTYEGNRAFLERLASGKIQITPELRVDIEKFGKQVTTPRLAPAVEVPGGPAIRGDLREAIRTRGPGPVAADHVNNMFGGLDYGKIGTSPFQQEVERLFLLAPGFWRARAGLFIQALKVGSPEGILADRFILESLGYAYGMSALFSWMAGEEPNLTDPSRSDWLTIKTSEGDINWLGGLRTRFRTIADVAVKLKEGKLDKAQWRLQRFGVGGLSIPLGLARELTINEDFFGRPIVTKEGFVAKWQQRLEHAGKSALPISAQAGLEGFVGGARAEPGAFIEFLGIGFIPKTLIARLDDEAQRRFKRPYSELGRAEQQELRGDPSLAPEIEEFERERERKIQAGKADLQEQVGFALQDSRQQYDNAIVAIEGLPPDEWRVQYRQIRDDYGANVGRLQRSPTFGRVFEKWNQGEPETERQAIFQRWMEQFDMSRDPITGIVDGDALGARLDRLEASITSQQLSDLQKDLGAKDPEAPTLREWRTDVKQLSAYWDVADDAMARFQRQGLVPRGVGSPSEFKEHLRRQMVDNALRRSPAADPLIVESIMNRILLRLPNLRIVEDVVQAERDRFLQEHPEVFRLLVKWGYREATESNLPLLIASSQRAQPSRSAAATR